ncbi:MAG: YjgP/YjgQ family permease [Candidatus Brocadiaceae bacterium]|nr:YjgP/YjgQ family permease [Candidatus Brocadiaceae bacterium]
MLFKKIDRYVSVAFLTRALGTALVITLLYVSFDVLKRLDELPDGDAAGGGRALVRYYSHVVPLFLVELAPGVILLAAGMLLVAMARSGELMALKACGTSVHRVVAPIFVWTALVSAGVFAVREGVAPRMAQEQQIQGRVLEGETAANLLLNDTAYARKYRLREYDFRRAAARDVAVVELEPGGRLVRVLQAASAHWTPGSVRLQAVAIDEFDPATGRAIGSDLLPEVVLPTDIGRAELLAASQEGKAGPPTQTVSDLRRAAREYPTVPYFRVALHGRLAGVFTPFILLLIGLPCMVGFERSVNSRFLGAILSIAVAAGLYTLTFVFSSMGYTGSLNTALAGWLPTVLAGALGLWLFEAMLT